MSEGGSGPGDFGAKFMLQEHSRIIDAYHDLHVQKNELLKFYLAFVSIPLSVVALFLSLSRFVPADNPATSAQPASASSQPPTAITGLNQTHNSNQPAGKRRPNVTSAPASTQAIPTGTLGTSQIHAPNQPPSLVGSLQNAATYLSLLLIPIGFAVIKTMLNIRTEQYLYVQTVNAARNFFKTTYHIDKQYLVLPSDPTKIDFGGNEIFGRTFWEAMIVSSPTSLLVGFLVYRLPRFWEMTGRYWWLLPALSALITFIGLSLYVGFMIWKKIHGLEARITAPSGNAPLRSSTELTAGKGDRSPSG
jgi:hypothetical protein